MDNSSGVGVIDKVVAVLDVLAAESLSLNHLAERTGIPRPTAHRLAVALEFHGLVARDAQGRFLLGERIHDLGRGSRGRDLVELAGPLLERLRDQTGESSQLYLRRGRQRVCVAGADRREGLRDTVPVGSVMGLEAGSAAQVLLAWADPAEPLPNETAFDAAELDRVRARGWAASVAEREPGVASVSAPVFAADGSLVAAVSVSGPIERLGDSPGARHAAAVMAAARDLSTALGN